METEQNLMKILLLLFVAFPSEVLANPIMRRDDKDQEHKTL